MVVVGLGGAGMQIARRGQAFGMRVVALDDRARERPTFVFGLDKLSKLGERLPQADVVVLACPLTERTRGLIDAGQLSALKKSALLINVSQAGLVDREALGKALKGKRLAGAGLVGELGEALRSLPNVVVSAKALPSPAEAERRWRLQRENVRRFVAGEPLLCVVGPQKGE
jgi:phosphoglycerate dehydrogenase-like enzyme